MQKNLNLWRESVSLIIAAKSPLNLSKKYNYKMLLLKRSTKSKFMPDCYVFPGGNSSKSDDDIKWLKLYENFGFNLKSFSGLLPKFNIPPILIDNNINKLPKYLSLRICAIRETFEECGILICKKNQKIENKSENWASFINFDNNLTEWQKKVNENPNEFYNLCKLLEIYPDVWSLHTWSNWATPKTRNIKFDTVFFISSINQMPNISIDNKEMKQFMWAHPDESISRATDDQIVLPPPQFYEISRIKNFQQIESLNEFAKERSDYGCEKYLPYEINTNKGIIGILPGDDLYPENIEPKYEPEIPFQNELENSNIKHRMKMEAKGNFIEIVNVIPKVKHILPLNSYSKNSNL